VAVLVFAFMVNTIGMEVTGGGGVVIGKGEFEFVSALRDHVKMLRREPFDGAPIAVRFSWCDGN
jgi:hypothetical protein